MQNVVLDSWGAYNQRRYGCPWVCVAAFRPLAPQRLDLGVQFVALGAGLQGEAFVALLAAK